MSKYSIAVKGAADGQSAISHRIRIEGNRIVDSGRRGLFLAGAHDVRAASNNISTSFDDRTTPVTDNSYAAITLAPGETLVIGRKLAC